ncbi:L-2-hydroxyglutarate oxidase [Nocardioides campestrisoli]|uniref:L-2-hydroxyglutarate oxidase n=1 Tax=Nocardioides campestrisoli TaxID=2736757 RepID=UPI0015E74A5D|nr:L-2-hydroxyglutarate oxidase [Nocardioides campestrisoli]
MAEQSIGVVGGGIVGLAVARELTRRLPGARVTVLEKESRLGTHQTGHNSGVVHAGIYYRPGSLKAELCTRGRLLLREYAAERGLPYEECGKLVVAVDRAELGRFDALERTARENGVPGLRRVQGADLTDVEPHAAGLVALHSPQTAITDYVAVAEAYGEDVVRAGGQVLLSTTVTGIRRRAGAITVTTDAGPHRFDRLVVCAGLQADRVSRMTDGVDGPRIVPFRGEYMEVAPAKRALVRGMVYPVPDPRYPFLGVHFTRRVTGTLEVGPNAVLGLAREGYRRGDLDLADVRAMATWPGTWRMASQHWRTGLEELRGSLSVRAYMRAASRYVPEIGAADVVRGKAGVRAQAVDRDGSLVEDFRIGHEDGITTVRNAPSPAATSSLAIAEHVVDQVLRQG